MNYGQKIAELRKGKNLTQADLGAKLNVSAQAVSKWENNLSEPDIESIRTLCEIFEISVDEFLGGSFSKKQPTEPAPAPQPAQQEKIKIINGYCEKCKKPVGPGEYKIGYFTYNPTSLTSKVQRAENQHIYCNACHLELTKLKSKEAQNRVVATKIAEKAERVESIKKGLLWGILPAAIILFASLIYFLKTNVASVIIGGSVLSVVAYTFTAQLFWNCFMSDVFFFFCRSFSMPFGLIFELSIDGILWLITVKLALWIICGLLSVVWFIIGLFVTSAISIVSFPIHLTTKIIQAR